MPMEVGAFSKNKIEIMKFEIFEMLRESFVYVDVV